MTTNDLIALILKDHYNADSLAQIAMAVECLQEQMADVAAARERMELDERHECADHGGEPSDEGADAEWLASAGWGTDEDYE